MVSPPETLNRDKEGTLETIFQSIEILSKEKGIDPQIVLDAVKDAMLIAARKHFRTNEDLRGGHGSPRPARSNSSRVKKVVRSGRGSGATR